MTRALRLALLLPPLALGLMSAPPLGRAQTADNSGRFAFADTTLLRDTLGISFQGLFPLADSLRTTPDTLRALAIRYCVPMWRLVAMADSMRAPLDSVGVRIERERYNPLARGNANVTEFNYGSGYNVLQNRSSWTSSLDSRFSRGLWYYSNITRIQIDRQVSTRSTTTRQTRHTENEFGWRMTPDASLGIRGVFDHFSSDDPSSITNIDEPSSGYQLSLRTRQQPSADLHSELNLLSGVLELDNALQHKRGGSGEVNGHVTYDVGSSLTNDVTGSLSGDLSHVDLKRTATTQDAHDVSGTLHATSVLWPTGAASVSSDVNYRNFFTQTPDDSDRIQNATNGNFDATGTLRLRGHHDQQFSLSQAFNTGTVASAVQSSQSDQHGNNLLVDGRMPLLGGTLEGHFGHDFSVSETPLLSDSGGYGGRTEDRSLEGTLSRQFGPKLVGRLNGRISLSRYRYFSIGRYITLPVPRDQAQQSYRAEGIYTASTDFNTKAALEVGRIALVNLPSASVLSNNVARSYRAEWSWTFRLLHNLTATQSNALVASYSDYPFNGQNNRLTLDYTTTTTLDAVLTPRLTVDLNHFAESQQGGNYLLQADGTNAFLPADDTKNYQIGTRVTWAPITGVSLAIEPRYRLNRRLGTVNGVAAPTSSDNNLQLTGSADLNIPLGKRGRLSGSIGRFYQDDLSRSFGTTLSNVKSQADNWTSNLQLTWHL